MADTAAIPAKSSDFAQVTGLASAMPSTDLGSGAAPEHEYLVSNNYNRRVGHNMRQMPNDFR